MTKIHKRHALRNLYRQYDPSIEPQVVRELVRQMREEQLDQEILDLEQKLGVTQYHDEQECQPARSRKEYDQEAWQRWLDKKGARIFKYLEEFYDDELLAPCHF